MQLAAVRQFPQGYARHCLASVAWPTLYAHVLPVGLPQGMQSVAGPDEDVLWGMLAAENAAHKEGVFISLLVISRARSRAEFGSHWLLRRPLPFFVRCLREDCCQSVLRKPWNCKVRVLKR